MLRHISEAELESYKNLIKILEEKIDYLKRELDCAQQSYEGQKANTLAFCEDVERLTEKLQEIREWGCALSDGAVNPAPGVDLLTEQYLGAILVDIVDHPGRLVVKSLRGYTQKEE